MVSRISVNREDDGRWLGEVSELPGVMAYGATDAEARTNTKALALRVVRERIAHGEPIPFLAAKLLVEQRATKIDTPF